MFYFGIIDLYLDIFRDVYKPMLIDMLNLVFGVHVFMLI